MNGTMQMKHDKILSRALIFILLPVLWGCGAIGSPPSRMGMVKNPDTGLQFGSIVDGSVITDIFERAIQLGLALCPLELAPYYRLHYRDQPEGSRGKPVLEHQAPYGSITIASAILTANDDFPKGFYLRRIEDVLWLRGYRSGADHIWSPNDRFAFLRAGEQR